MSVTELIVGMSVLFHLVAAILALRLIKVTGHKSAWVLLTIAIIIQLLRRVMSFWVLVSNGKTFSLRLDECIVLIISFVTLLGVAFIAPHFQSIRRSEEEMKHAKIKAEEERAKTQAIIAAIGDGISIQDRDLTIIYQNTTLAHCMGEHVGEKCYRAYRGTNAPCRACPVLACFEKGTVETTELTYATHTGVSCFETTTSPIQSGKGDILSSIMLLRNIDQRKREENEKERLIRDLNDALANIKTLRGLIPTCASCKKIRNSDGDWEQMETYVQNHSEAQFSHGLCPECTRKLYPDYSDRS